MKATVFASLFNAAVAAGDLIQGNCDGAACTSICDCAYDSCSTPVNACLGDPTCAAAQSCVLGCACGDNACAAACASGAGTLGADVLKCLTSSCGGESFESLMKGDVEQGNCDGAACTSICECAYDSCSTPVNACLADPTCAAAQSCVLGCACGDNACAAACASGAGTLGADVLKCLTSSCGGESLDVEQGNCDGAACTSICECAYDSCSTPVNACLADPTCAAAQSCVLGCACGDNACAAACASGAGTLGADVLKCLTSSCGGESFESLMKGDAEQGNCDGAACTSICECAYDSCSTPVNACLADPTCAAAQSCVLGCACGDNACAAACASGAGTLGADVLKCLTSSCGGESFESLMKGDAEQGNCDGAACTSICECAYDSCSTPVNACLADPTCAAAQSCVLGCACGDNACAAACASGAGTLGADVLKCLTSSCGGDPLII